MAVSVSDEKGDRIEVLVLPDSKHEPALKRKRGVDLKISRDISGELGPPVRRVRSRNIPVGGTAMPKAAIDEHRQLCASEYNIRADRAAGGADREIDPESKAPSVQG